MMSLTEKDALLASPEINWAETMDFKPSDPLFDIIPDLTQILTQMNRITFQEALAHLVMKINRQINFQMRDAREGDSLQKLRCVYILDIAPDRPIDNAYFFSAYKSNGVSWTTRILNLLVEKGYLFSADKYRIQA